MAQNSREISVDFRFYLKLAASLCIVVLAGFAVYNFQEVDIATARGEHQQVVLPDNSTVELNAGSSLTYNTFLFAFSRKIYFAGEGFFSVMKGSRFEVVSQQGTVEVLGTQFNILSRRDTYEVACAKGKVKVTNSTNVSGVLLTAGLKTSLLDKKLGEPSTFQPEATAWRNGEFYFDNSPLSEVLSTLELQYDVKIYFDGSTDRSYTGYFRANNLEESLKLVCLPLALEYQILNKKEIKLISKINY